MTDTVPGASYVDIARAARWAAAWKAGDQSGHLAVINEILRDGRWVGFAVAMGVRHVQVCDEFYDTDCQQILDEFAFDANAMANRERLGDV
jgi:hypothetical protein